MIEVIFVTVPFLGFGLWLIAKVLPRKGEL